MRRHRRTLGRFLRKLSLREWAVFFAIAKSVVELVLEFVRNG
jgi:hypothetical protein